MGYNFHAMPGQRETINTGADRVTINKIGVTSEAVALVVANASRRTVWINNLGSTDIWVGGSNNITPGVTGINFGNLDAASNTEIRDYRGPVYGVVGASAATVGVSSAGSSIAPCWIGTADIG